MFLTKAPDVVASVVSFSNTETTYIIYFPTFGVEVAH